MNAAVQRPGLARVAPVLVGLLVVWVAGGLWLARRGAERHEVVVADTVAAVRALVDAAARELRREAALLAKDPAIVEGALKHDWATLARGASPRMLALTLERVADLLCVVDATGALLVQVPATPRVEGLALPRPAEAVTRVAVVNNRAYLVGLAPLPAGMVVVGRRVESLARVLDGLPSRPAVVVLVEDLAVGGTLPGVPPRGWRDAARGRRVTVDGQSWLARPLDDTAGESLWALVPEGARRVAERRFWFAWALSLVAATGVALVAGAVVARTARAEPAWPSRAVGAGAAESASVGAGAGWSAPTMGGPTKERDGSDTLEALRAVAVATGNGDDLVATAERTLEVVCGVARTAFGGLFRLDPVSQTLVLVAHRGFSPEDVAVLRVRPLDASHVGEAVRAGHLILTDLTRSRVLTPAVRERVVAGGYHTQLSLPITVSGAVWGVMALISREPRTFDGDELTLLQAVAHQVGQAVARTARFVEARERSRRLETLTRLAQTLTATLSVDEVVQRVVDAAAELFDSSVARLWLVDDDGAQVTLRASVGARGAGEGRPPLRVGEGLVGTVVATREPLAVADVLGDPRTRNVAQLRAEGTASAAVVPLLVGDRVLGALSIGVRERHEYTREELDVLGSLALHAANALNNARQFSEESARRAYLGALLEINKKIGGMVPTETLLSSIAEEAARLLDVDNAGFRLLQGEELVLAGLAGTAAQTMTRPRIRVGESLSGRVVATGRTLVCEIQSVPDVAPENVEADRRLGYTMFLGVPLRVGARTIGALAFRARRAFTARDAEIAEAFADQAAIALDQARLYSETAGRLEETGALLEVVEILNSTLDAKRLLQRVAIKIAQVCRVDRCSVAVWEGGEITPLMAQYADGRKAPEQWTAFQGMASRPLHEIPANARALESRRPVVVNDARASDLLPREWVETFALGSYLVVPLIRQDQVAGIMTLDYCERPTPFEPWQVNLAMTIAGQLALALANTRLYTEAQERLRETTTLMSVGQILSRSQPVGERMRHVAREVARAFGADMVGAYFLDERKETLVPLGGYHVPRHLLAWFATRPIVLARVPDLLPAWRAGRAIWSADPLHDPRFDPNWLEGLPPHSVLLASATARGEPIGALFVVWWRPGRRFQPTEIRLVEGLAAQVGLVMENAELARQTEVKLRETETLLSVSRTFSSTLDLQALLRHFLRRVTQAVDADSAGVWLREGDGEWLEPVAGYRLPPDRLEELRRIRLSLVRDPFFAEAARTRRPVASSDVAADPRASAVMRDVVPHRSHLFVPIVAKERMIGGFGLIWYERVREFSASELALMEVIANQAGVAIDNARLFEENRRQVQELAVLHELSRAVTGQLERAALIDAIHAQVARVLDVRNMVIALHDEERRELEIVLRIVEGVPDARPPLRYPDRASGLMSVVRETGRAIRTDNYEAECARLGVEAIRTSADLGHWLGVPMAAGDRVLGVLALRGGERPFTERDERLLTNLAHLAALALRSARLFEERTRAYRELAAAQDQLVRTEKLRALGEMASGVAHDFNNLLASILGRAQLTLQRVNHPQLRQWLQVIERAALDGAQTVRRLQEFTRIRRDQPFVAVDLNEVVREALEITQARWREEAVSRGVMLEVKSDLGALPKVAGDPVELREALTNLILNAVDAMPDGGVLTLTTAVVDGAVVVTVGDTGVGISPTIRDRIFDPFFTTKGPQGTGLGLSMTYAILERHGARITVDSEERRGTTFRLTFAPAWELEAPATEPAPPAPPGEVSLRCLVVDDEPTVGAMLGDVLETGGHRAVVATDGSEAIARFGAEPFDVVFTDLAMPRVSGWQVARAIKEMAPTVPVIMVTGFGVELSAEERRAHGVDLVLVKPLRIQEILDVASQVARRRVWRT
ncbi:MAG: hypothetical protein DMD93_07115 [Candidatus Rokuibacteriota bacterium]|nr:MAG: hypothetical protein DMD93_07115 [Candidatus Rokubacteria bacterium]